MYRANVDGLLAAQETADKLGYHSKYVYPLLKQGTIEAEPFNRVWVIDRQEVERVKALQGSG